MKLILSNLLDSVKDKGSANRYEQCNMVSHLIQVYPEKILDDIRGKISASLSSLTCTCFTTLISTTREHINLSDSTVMSNLTVTFQGITNVWLSLIKRLKNLSGSSKLRIQFMDELNRYSSYILEGMALPC